MGTVVDIEFLLAARMLARKADRFLELSDIETGGKPGTEVWFAASQELQEALNHYNELDDYDNIEIN